MSQLGFAPSSPKGCLPQFQHQTAADWALGTAVPETLCQNARAMMTEVRHAETADPTTEPPSKSLLSDPPFVGGGGVQDGAMAKESAVEKAAPQTPRRR